MLEKAISLLVSLTVLAVILYFYNPEIRMVAIKRITKKRFSEGGMIQEGITQKIGEKIQSFIENKTALAKFKYHESTAKEYKQLMVFWCLPFILGGIGLLGSIMVPGKFVSFMAVLLFGWGCYIPWKFQHSLVQDFERERDSNLGEFFETLSLFIGSGHSIDRSLALSAQTAGDIIKSPVRELVLELGAMTKNEAIDNFTRKVGGVQVKLFGDALKQGYNFSPDFLIEFFSTQTQIMANLRSQKVQEAIRKAPNKATIANVMIAFAAFLIIVAPYAINMFEGLTK